MYRRLGLVSLVAAFAVLVGTTGLAGAQPPADVQAMVWEQACEQTGGELSPQSALVCVNTTPFTPAEEAKLQRICEHVLGGTLDERSEFPVVLAGCFDE